MVLTLNLPPDLESRLQEMASQEGLATDEFVTRLIEREFPLVEAESGLRTSSSGGTPSERIREFFHWAATVHPDLPVVPEEALRRESLYEDRW